MNISDEQISMAEYLATNTLLQVILIIRFLIGVIGIMTLLTLLPYRRCFVAHKSLILLLAQHCLWSFVQSLSTSVESAIVLYQHCTYRSIEDLFHFNTGQTCLIRSGAQMLSLGGGIYSMLVITIERWYASKNYKSYESAGSRLGYGLCILQLSLALLFFYGIVYFYNVEPLYARCNLITEEGVFFQKLHGSFLTCVQLFSLFTFARLRHLNAHKLDVGCSTLTERYQLTENVRTMHLLVPVVWSHIFLNLLVITAYLVMHSIELNVYHTAVGEEALGFYHLHSVIVPLIMFFRHREELSSRKELIQINYTGDGSFAERHLNYVQKSW